MPRRRSTPRDAVAYSIYDRNDKRTYIGSTNNPRHRSTVIAQASCRRTTPHPTVSETAGSDELKKMLGA